MDNWIKARAIDPGMVVSIPTDDGSSPRGEVISTEQIDVAMIRVDFRHRSTWVHPDERIEVFPLVDEEPGDIRGREALFVAMVGAPACDLIGA